MTYNGYFEFGGIELANAARSQAYAEAFGFGALRGCEPCGDLGAVLGFGDQRGAPHRQEVLSVLTNIAPNPSFETNATGFTLGPNTASIARITTPAAAIAAGVAAALITGTAGTQTVGSAWVRHRLGGTIGVGQRVAVSLSARQVSGGATFQALSVEFYDASNVLVGGSSSGTFETLTTSGNSSPEARKSVVSAPAPAGTDYAVLVINYRGPNPGSVTSPSWTVHIDGIIAAAGYESSAELADQVEAFWDGATTDTYNIDYAWTGTANNSMSTRTLYDYYGDIIASTSYIGPAQDPAPWFDPGRRASEDFLGFYTTRVDAIDDSTREAELISLVGDGTAVSRVRRAGREMRFEGVLMAMTDEGLDVGLTWLGSALDSYRCDGSMTACDGGDLRFLSSCPSIEVTAPADVIVNWDGTNPAAEAAKWSGYGGGVFNATGSLNFAASTPPSGYVEREITGLVSGQWYLLSMTVLGQGRLTVEVADSAVAMPVLASTFTDQVPFQMEFLARSSTETVRVRGTGPASSLTTDLPVSSLRIVRTLPGSVVDQANFAPTTGGVHGFGWAIRSLSTPVSVFNSAGGVNSPTASQNPDTLRTYTSGWNAYRKVRTGSAGTLQTTSGVARISLGTLEPGSYRADFWMHFDKSIATMPGAMGLRVTVGGTSTSVLTTSTPSSGIMPTKYTVNFTVGTEGEQFLDITTSSAATSVAVNEWIEMTPVFLQVVNLSNQVSVPAPDSTLKFWRTMHNVTAIAGPAVLERFELGCGVAARVSFGLVAGDPRKYKEERDLGRKPIGLGGAERAWRCRNGQAYRYNYLINPTFDATRTGWTDTGTTTNPYVWNAAAIDPTAGFGPGRIQGGVGGAGQTLAIAGQIQIRVSGWYHTMFAATADASGYTVAVGTSPGASDVALVAAQQISNSTSSQWYADFYLNSTAGSFPVPRTLYVDYRRNSTITTPTGAVQMDAVLVGDGRYQRGDGWFGGRMGTTYLSWYQTEPPRVEPIEISRSNAWDAFSITYLIPDERQVPSACLRFPVMPRPPVFQDLCSDLPQVFQFHTEIPIAPGALSTSGTVVPVLRFYLRDEGADLGAERSISAIRMRWYRNPTGRPVSEIPPCSYDAEITVANVPVNSLTTVDAALRVVHTESLPVNNDIFSVDIPQAAFGPDMGGVEWPELRCGEQYTLVIDVDESTGGGTGDLWPSSYVEIGLVPVA